MFPVEAEWASVVRGGSYPYHELYSRLEKTGGGRGPLEPHHKRCSRREKTSIHGPILGPQYIRNAFIRQINGIPGITKVEIL